MYNTIALKNENFTYLGGVRNGNYFKIQRHYVGKH